MLQGDESGIGPTEGGWKFPELGFGKLPATRSASNPRFTEPGSKLGFYLMSFR